MSDKSPRSHESKKAGQTIKQKRADKKSAAATKSASVIPTTGHGGK